MSKTLAENEVFELRRQIGRLLEVPGSEEKITRLQIQIAHLQHAHGAMSGVKHEQEKEMELESLEKLIVEEDREIPGLCAEISGTTEKAFARLLARRDAAYLSAVARLDRERESLEGERVSLAEAERNLSELIPARMRQAQFEADALLVAGRIEEAKAKRTEAQEAEHAPEAIKERQRIIAARIEAIAGERKTIAKHIFQEWYSECQSVVRSAEHGLFIVLLEGLRADFFRFESSVRTDSDGTANVLYHSGHLDGLTADANSELWQTGQKWYKGRQ
jgi:hypothetical protein